MAVSPRDLLWYEAPAAHWEAALPLGNGRIGAMIPGGIVTEEITLNEDTLWSGRPGLNEPRPDGPRHLAEARRLIRARQFSAAGRYVTAHLLDTTDSASFLPAGTLQLQTPELAATDFYRELDLTTAVARTRFRASGVGFEREYFISAPDQLLVGRWSADRPGCCALRATLLSPLPHQLRVVGDEVICDGVCPFFDRYDRIEWLDAGGRGGIRFQMRLRVLAEGGEVSVQRDALEVRGADAITLLLAIRSNFVDFATEPEDERHIARVGADLDRGGALGYRELCERHRRDYTVLYRRAELQLADGPADQAPTDRRLSEAGTDFSPALAALFWNYGRYLAIASSRPGTQPANLQGIWNHLMSPSWGSNYTTNINLQMNYWLSEVANLADCAEPLFRMIREAAVTGRRVAREKYNCDGWCLHHNSDLWRYAGAATGDARWGFFPLGGVWLCRHLAEHYRYTLDRDFLREYFPVLLDAARFCCDFLVEIAPGEWGTMPSTSPENAFRDPVSGEITPVAAASAIDMALVREIFDAVLEFAPVVECHDAILAMIRERRGRLRSDRLGSDGALLEYGEEFQESEPEHRHLSHLYAAYPGAEYATAEWAPVIRRNLARRGDLSTGWAMTWRVALWARLGDGEQCRKVLTGIMNPVDPAQEILVWRGGTYPNLFDAHPPFQIDGNFGVTAAICEMLLQSHRVNAAGHICLEVLPALPAAWADGSFRGWRARGAVTVDCVWRNGVVSSLELTAPHGGTFEVVVPGWRRGLTLVPGVRTEVVAAQA